MNVTANLKNLETVDREMEAEVLKEKIMIIQEALRAELCEPRYVPEKPKFLKQFERIRNRYNFLVLHGGICTGKTVKAKC